MFCCCFYGSSWGCIPSLEGFTIYPAIWLAKIAHKILRCFLFVQSYHEMTCDWLMPVAIFKPIQQLCLHYEFETCRRHVLIFHWKNRLYSFYSGLEIDSPYQHGVSYPTRSWKPAANAVFFWHGSSTLKCNPNHVTEVTAVCAVCKNQLHCLIGKEQQGGVKNHLNKHYDWLTEQIFSTFGRQVDAKAIIYAMQIMSN